ncbi:MAG: TetR/AcrR family transcriptional regulator [Anaerolineae bacterium]|jgi:AcrR family transcriptional regulator|nr:TetR/AcrR family transcriptional regulator [Anaerolineae bacterium]
MNRKQHSAQDTRARLIAAALAALRAGGLHGLTLDSVAKTARVSKGGLLHHFPSKEALAEAVLRHLLGQFEQQVQAHYDQDTTPRGRWLRAYLRASFAPEAVLTLELATTLLLALAEFPGIRAQVQQDAARWTARLADDGVPPLRARLLRLAADAWWQDQMATEHPATPAERAALLHEALRLIDQE